MSRGGKNHAQGGGGIFAGAQDKIFIPPLANFSCMPLHMERRKKSIQKTMESRSMIQRYTGQTKSADVVREEVIYIDAINMSFLLDEQLDLWAR